MKVVVTLTVDEGGQEIKVRRDIGDHPDFKVAAMLLAEVARVVRMTVRHIEEGKA